MLKTLNLLLRCKPVLEKGIPHQIIFLYCIHLFLFTYLLVKKCICTFIDFKKAFDTVWRLGLWQKFIKSNISGKIFKVIYNLYKDTKSCISHSGKTSDLSHVEQGPLRRKPFPFLFALYLNDLEEYLETSNIKKLEKLDNLALEQLNTYIRLFILLYADDTVIFSETLLLNILYCSIRNNWIGHKFHNLETSSPIHTRINTK